MNDPLPLLDSGSVSCAGCGACCTQVGTPPGFYALFCSPEWDGKFLADSEDHAIWLGMPPDVRAELEAYYTARDADLVPDRAREEQPCLWYDADARGCRHYESRPVVCREFEVGGESCLAHRAVAGVPSPTALPAEEEESIP